VELLTANDEYSPKRKNADVERPSCSPKDKVLSGLCQPESAGINRHVVGDERALQGKTASNSPDTSEPAEQGNFLRRPGREGHRLRRTSFNHTCVRHRAGNACPRDCAVCGQQHVSPPFIHSKSRMRKRARTDLSGGHQRWSSLPRQLSSDELSLVVLYEV